MQIVCLKRIQTKCADLNDNYPHILAYFNIDQQLVKLFDQDEEVWPVEGERVSLRMGQSIVNMALAGLALSRSFSLANPLGDIPKASRQGLLPYLATFLCLTNSCS